MAEALSSLYNTEQVLNLLEEDRDDDEFDDELGLFEDDEDGSDSGSDDDSNDEAKVRWISSKEGRSYKNCAVRCNGDHAFQFPCSDDRSTIGANVK